MKLFARKGDKPEKGGEGGVDVEIGGCSFFITLQFNHIYSACVCVCVCVCLGGGGRGG